MRILEIFPLDNQEENRKENQPKLEEKIDINEHFSVFFLSGTIAEC